MILDQFDQDVFSASGRAADILQEFYGIKISQNSARKYIAGIRKHLSHKRKLANPNQTNSLSETVTKGDGSKTTKRMVMLSESDANDQFRIMQLMGFDPLKWELISCKTRRNDWDVTMKLTNGDGEGYYPHRETNHQYKIELSVKPIQEVLTSDYIKKVFEELVTPKLSKVKYIPGRLMLELPIMDLHLGKLAWAEETGQDYDLKIAEQLYRETVLDILGKVAQCNFKIDRIVFPVGQDFYHVDNDQSKTTAGTQVDTDSRWQKMYRKGVELLVWTIEELRQLAPVEVMYVPGNHDHQYSYFAVYTLLAHFRDCEGVTVDISPTPRKYIRYGVNLIGLSHGKEGKRIEHLMQQERPQDWGKTQYREWHLGDLHHEEATEIGGIKIRRISSITATDAWHAEKGYRAIRMAQAFIWDKEKGRQFVIDSNVEVS
jgi:hypothetical protein